ncbi:MAG: DUF1364 family protein [Oceanospirillaceae bacterium]|nr:DUF1364 family protein [Oceanospirillaceae bacterium]
MHCEARRDLQHNPATTTLARLNDGSQGMGLKANNISSCFASSAGHDAIDGRVSNLFEPGYLAELKFLENQAMIHIWNDMGLITITASLRQGVK